MGYIGIIGYIVRIYRDNGREHGQGLNNFLQGTGVAVADNGRTRPLPVLKSKMRITNTSVRLVWICAAFLSWMLQSRSLSMLATASNMFRLQGWLGCILSACRLAPLHSCAGSHTCQEYNRHWYK